MRKHGPFFISISEVPVRSDAEKSPEGGEGAKNPPFTQGSF